jgi:RNA polymerase sigma-70 factor (ECF subfamily)
VSGARDETGFDSFFDGSWRRLQGQAYVMTGSRETAQDLTQEALLRAWRHWDTVSKLDSPEAWTRKVLQHLCIESWRKSRRRKPKTDVPAHAEIPESHTEIAQAMRGLPGQHARALLLHDGLGMTVSEVAADLGVPDGTVKSWLSRSRKVVAERLGQLDHDPARR